MEHSLPETNIMAESLMTVGKKINILSKIVPYSSLTFAVEEDKRLHGVNETKVGPKNHVCRILNKFAERYKSADILKAPIIVLVCVAAVAAFILMGKPR